MMQNMSFVATYCFIIVPVRVIIIIISIIIIATIATSSQHAVTQNSIPVTSHISSELNSRWSTTRIQDMCTYINHNFVYTSGYVASRRVSYFVKIQLTCFVRIYFHHG